MRTTGKIVAPSGWDGWKTLLVNRGQFLRKYGQENKSWVNRLTLYSSGSGLFWTKDGSPFKTPIDANWNWLRKEVWSSHYVLDPEKRVLDNFLKLDLRGCENGHCHLVLDSVEKEGEMILSPGYMFHLIDTIGSHYGIMSFNPRPSWVMQRVVWYTNRKMVPPTIRI